LTSIILFEKQEQILIKPQQIIELQKKNEDSLRHKTLFIIFSFFTNAQNLNRSIPLPSKRRQNVTVASHCLQQVASCLCLLEREAVIAKATLTRGFLHSYSFFDNNNTY
jgi:hypothetical protein